MAELDHIVVVAKNLAEGVAYVEASLGVQMQAGGVHTGFGTHNKLLSLGPDAYLEVIAPNPDDPNPKSARMFDLDNYSGPPRLKNWVIRSKNVGVDAALAPPEIGKVQALSRGNLRWLMTKPDTGKLPFDGAYPAIIEWQSDMPAPQLTPSGCHLQRLEIDHPADRALTDRLGLVLNDAQVSIAHGPAFVMRAHIMTPTGLLVLD